MKTFRVEIKPTAENDLERRYLQIAEDSPQNAFHWYVDIIESIEKLEILAERCPVAPEDEGIQQGVRHLIIGDYRVLYRLRGEAVEVLHIRHGRMDRKL